MRWKPVKHPYVLEGYMVSQFGDIKAENSADDKSFKADYHASNGYDFALMLNAEENLQLFPIDEIIASAFIIPPNELINKPLKIHHINGDTHDISLDNLEWVEDIEEWKTVEYPNIRPNMYEVSSWGRARRIGSKDFKSFTQNKKGYLTTGFRQNSITDETLVCQIHRVICYVWYPVENFQDLQVNHINGIKTDNSPKNLEWCTNSINHKHKMMTGLQTKRPSKISTDEIDMIFDLLMKNNGSPIQVYRLLNHKEHPNLTLNVIRDIRRLRKTYRRSNKYDINKIHFEKIIPPIPRNFGKLSTVTLDIIRDIMMEYNGSIKKTYDECLKLKIDASKNMIMLIKYGRGYRNSYRYDLNRSSCYPWIRKD